MAVSRHVIAASKAIPTCKIKGFFTLFFLKKKEDSCMCLFHHVILNSLGMRVSLASSSFQT